jgi:SAM-dependent methyltransferase
VKRLTTRDLRIYDRIWSDRAPGPASAATVALVARLLEDAQPRRRRPRLADLGCGIGRNALHAARLGIDVVAVDHHPRAIAMLRAASIGLPVTVVHADLPDWLEEQTDQSYDAVTCCDCLHHLSPDADVILSTQHQLRRIVRLGGHVLVTLLCDISYSCGERPSGRLSLDVDAGAELIHRAFGGLECILKECRHVNKPGLFGLDERTGEIVPTDYSANRLLRWFRIDDARHPLSTIPPAID